MIVHNFKLAQLVVCCRELTQQSSVRAWLLLEEPKATRPIGLSVSPVLVRTSPPAMAHLSALFKYVDEHQDLYVQVRSCSETPLLKKK